MVEPRDLTEDIVLSETEDFVLQKQLDLKVNYSI